MIKSFIGQKGFLVIRHFSVLRSYSVALLIGVVLLIAGCSEPDPMAEASEFQGTWVLQWADGTKATLIFDPDGTFSAKNIPRNTFYQDIGDPSLTSPDQLRWDELKDFKGTWSIQAKSETPYLMMKGSQPSESAFLYRSSAQGKPALLNPGGGPGRLDIYFIKTSEG